MFGGASGATLHAWLVAPQRSGLFAQASPAPLKPAPAVHVAWQDDDPMNVTVCQLTQQTAPAGQSSSPSHAKPLELVHAEGFAAQDPNSAAMP